MTDSKNIKDIKERFIHEIIHMIARDEETMNTIRDFTAIIINKWEDYKEKNFKEGE